ncbi:MAG TPA: threonine synthase [Saprospiraceae bacterium]|nr:threonine synthase [Saprospiraceae bacterium]
MLYYSTNDSSMRASLRQALFQGLPADNGLFMPEHIPTLPNNFIQSLPDLSFPELSFHIARAFLQEDIPSASLRSIVEAAINFPAPVHWLNDTCGVLELFHGPTLAFKDFGARFMAGLMGYFTQQEDKETTILVATSGDTGGAVAAGFLNTPGIRVVILYPSGKVSDLQEKQLTTLGANISALEVKGTFDDCQSLVKQAFLDQDLTAIKRLSSANSINIARLIPQSFYYFEAYKQIPGPLAQRIVFTVPSGNFGNLTAGLLAKRMGLPVHRFLAATNANDVVPQYLHSGIFSPRRSVSTLSNAMDVGNPSNFARMMDLYGSTWNNIRHDISGYCYTDEETAQNMVYIRDKYAYTADPHTSVGLLADRAHRDKESFTGIVLSTAHPAKFIKETSEILKTAVSVPDRLARLAHLPKHSVQIAADYAQFKAWLMDH